MEFPRGFILCGGQGVDLFDAMNTPRPPCSPSNLTDGLVYFARMLDKIRLHQRGELDAGYHENLGRGFDARCCEFLGVAYEEVVARVGEGLDDLGVMDWCRTHGRPVDPALKHMFNEFLRKWGLRDEASGRLQTRLAEIGQDGRTDIHTFFEFIDLDEGRLPRT